MNVSTQSLPILRQYKAYAVLAISALATIVSGCADAGGQVTPSNLALVFGKVTLDDDSLAAATVNFIPASSTKGTGGFAITDADGNFDAFHYSQAHGLEPGVYNVTFSKLLLPDGSSLPEGAMAADVGAVESMPAHLTQVWPSMHPYKITVTSDLQPTTFALTSKPPKN